jgi:hypothetical protein
MKNILLDNKFSDLVLKKINNKISQGLINNKINVDIQNKKIITNDINSLSSVFVMPDNDENDYDDNSTNVKNRDNLSIESIDSMYLNSVNGISIDTTQITINMDKLEIEPVKRKRGRPRKNNLVDSSECVEI